MEVVLVCMYIDTSMNELESPEIHSSSYRNLLIKMTFQIIRERINPHVVFRQLNSHLKNNFNLYLTTYIKINSRSEKNLKHESSK